jgi:hypothetical protein
MPRQIKNLSLDPEAVRRGELYSKRHRTNVSQLVSNFLASLPVEAQDEERPLSAAVRRLLGIGAGTTDRDWYRLHLKRKHGA